MTAPFLRGAYTIRDARHSTLRSSGLPALRDIGTWDGIHVTIMWHRSESEITVEHCLE